MYVWSLYVAGRVLPSGSIFETIQRGTNKIFDFAAPGELVIDRWREMNKIRILTLEN